MSKIVSGHAITEKGIENLTRDRENEQRQTKTSKTVPKKRQSNSKHKGKMHLDKTQQ